jgi:hypothetical protein
MPLWAAAAVAAAAAWFLTTHYLHIFSENINWDEFAMLERADRSVRFGTVVGDGRAGLGTIVLMPFVKGCIDAARSVVEARQLWMVVTVAYLIGVYCLVRRWFVHVGRADEGRAQGLIAVALLTFLPAFVVWSVQVRTDQAALAAIVWGGVLLLGTRYWQSIAAGGLFAVGLLFTQKGLYALALVGVLFATATAARGFSDGGDLRAEIWQAARRLGVGALAGLVVIGIYAYFVPDVVRLTSESMIAGSLETMRMSRQGQGYRIYTIHAARLVVHWVFFAVLVAWTVRVLWNRDKPEVFLVATSWLALLLGLIVIMVHGSSFPYFIMTAGLFPALALSMPAGRPLAGSGRWSWALVVLAVVLSAAQSSRESREMLQDTQGEQRETLRLVYDSPLRNRRGYQGEGALFCMRDPKPMPVMFSPMIYQRFIGSPQGIQNRTDWIEEFRSRPIAYIVESYRLSQFPDEIRDFWSKHYIWYARSLYIPGYDIAEPREVDIIVPGQYRWDADPNSPAASLQLGNAVLRPDEEINLPKGSLPAQAIGENARGQLILADLPRPKRDGSPFFYLRRQIAQLGGRY